ncbi:MAG: hypothetical protein QXU32_11935 [Nitrososphaerales archaeon]
MRYAVYFAIASGIVLLLPWISNTYAAAVPTNITLEVSSSRVHLNDTVTFSGSLADAATGEGLAGKTIVIYREGPIIPMPLVTATTGVDGTYSVDWTPWLETNRDMRVTVFAQFDGESDLAPGRSGKTSFTVALKPLELVMTTDGNKNRYHLGEKAFFSIALSDGMGNFVDPDFLRATYDGNFVEMKRQDIGRYTFETPYLVKFEQHQFGVFAEKWGFKPAQKSVTITTFGVKDNKPIKVTASMRSDDIRILIRNTELSPSKVYTFTGTFLGAIPVDGSATNWQFSIDRSTNSFTFKTTESYLAPGHFTTLKIKVNGSPTTLTWKAFDLYGKEHSTVRDIAGSGSTIVRAIRS